MFLLGLRGGVPPWSLILKCPLSRASARPLAGQNRYTPARALSAVTAGSSLPSKNSRKAPPPVDR